MMSLSGHRKQGGGGEIVEEKKKKTKKKQTPAKGHATKSKGGKKSWKKPDGFPKRPLSAYNLFFRDERNSLVEGAAAEAANDDADPTSSKTLDEGGDDHNNDTIDNDADSSNKRKHRKSHGKVGFVEMARLIGERWKSLKAEDRKVYQDEAKGLKMRYVEQLEEFKKNAAAAAAAVKQKPMMEIDEEEEKEESQCAVPPPFDDSAATNSTSSMTTTGETTKQGSKGGGEDRERKASSPRSETAAFLLDISQRHRATAAAAAAVSGNDMHPAGAGSSGVDLSSRVRSSNVVGSLRGSSSGLSSTGGFGRPFAGGFSGSLSSLPGGLSSSSTSAAASHNMALTRNEKIFRLRELYRLHLVEAASLRAELQRELAFGGVSTASSAAFLEAERTRADLLALEQAQRRGHAPSALFPHLQQQHHPSLADDNTLLEMERQAASIRSQRLALLEQQQQHAKEVSAHRSGVEQPASKQEEQKLLATSAQQQEDRIRLLEELRRKRDT